LRLVVWSMIRWSDALSTYMWWIVVQTGEGWCCL